MRSLSRQHSMKLAVSAVLAGIGLFAIGCDERAADRKAISQFEKGDWKAAASEKDASPVVNAIASGRAAEDQMAKALPAYRELVTNQILISDGMWYLSRLASTASHIQASAGYLANYNPSAALALLDKTLQQVKGDGQGAWSPANVDVQMPTLSALNTRSNQLKDSIAEIERNIADLKQKQQAATESADKLMDQSKAQKGEKSLALFRQSADARKQATALTIQMDQAQSSLVPLQQELAVVQDQITVAGEAVNIMSGHRDNIEKSWRGITAQADQRAANVAAIFARGTPERPGTIAAQATRLSELLAKQDKLATTYEQQLQDANALAKQAVSSSEKAIKEAQSIKASGSNKAANPNELYKLAVDPSTARYDQANIELSLGSHQAGRASLMATRAHVLQDVTEIAAQLKQQLPEGLDAAAAKADAEKLATGAADNLKSADALFGTVSEAPAAPAFTKRSATIGQMFASHSEALLATTQGDAAAAKQFFDQAKALRDRLAEGGEPLPSLPPSLQGSAAPANPATTPAVEKQ